MATIRELELGVWLDESVPDDFRHDAEALCYLLSTCIADLVVSLSMFEKERGADHERMQRRVGHDEWQRDRDRERQCEEKLAAEQNLGMGQPDYFDRSAEIREQAKRMALHTKWAEQGEPDSYSQRRVFIHAQSFVTSLALIQRSLNALAQYAWPPDVASQLAKASDSFAAALPGLKEVRDSAAHVEDRVRGKARRRTIATQPVMNNMIHAPRGGAMVVGSLNNSHYGGTIADGTYAEVEVADATTEIARSAVQATFDALPWRPGHRRHEPSQ